MRRIRGMWAEVAHRSSTKNEVRIPAGMDQEAVMNECIRHALRVEGEFGFAILTRVKETGETKVAH